MSIMLSSWLRNSSSLRGAGFFGGIGKPHHGDQHTESQHEFRRKPPRAQARKIASFLPNPAPNLANPITSIPPKPTRFQRFQPFSRATSELERLRIDVERICELSGYKGLWVDARDYLVHRIGQSFLYDVPMCKRGNLAEFAGKRIRVVCTHNGTNQRYVRIGVIGDAPERKKVHRKKASDPASLRPRLPRLLHEDELASTPHLLARFDGIWRSGGGMARAFNRGLRYQAAVWYARRFREWTGAWPQGTHEFIIKYGPTDDFEIRTPIGDHQGYCEIRLHFEVHPAGAAFVTGNDEVGFNWCAFAIEELEGDEERFAPAGVPQKPDQFR